MPNLATARETACSKGTLRLPSVATVLQLSADTFASPKHAMMPSLRFN